AYRSRRLSVAIQTREMTSPTMPTAIRMSPTMCQLTDAPAKLERRLTANRRIPPTAMRTIDAPTLISASFPLNVRGIGFPPGRPRKRPAPSPPRLTCPQREGTRGGIGHDRRRAVAPRRRVDAGAPAHRPRLPRHLR